MRRVADLPGAGVQVMSVTVLAWLLSIAPVPPAAPPTAPTSAASRPISAAGSHAVDGAVPARSAAARQRAKVNEPASSGAGQAVPGAIATEVRISSEPGVVLAGTLYLPGGHGKGPYPLAVLIKGQGRYGRGGYSEIIKRLTADGIAALEYDKRGVGQSTGTYEEDPERLTADAAAAVAAMRRRPEIVGSRIALVGHSGGGVIAPAAAAADPHIVAVVTLAGNVGDGLPYVRKGIYRQMMKMIVGGSDTLVGPAADAAVTLLQARVDSRDAETIARLRANAVARFEAAGFPRPQAEQALAMIDVPEAWNANKFHSASDLKTLHIPVLAVYGTMDPMALDDAPAARAALASNRRARIVMLDGLGHSFQEGEVTGTPDGASNLGPYLGSPRLLTLVGDWLRDTLSEGGKEMGQVR
ncbi:alpha/beta hydrolase [Sphingomonas ginkgonis]|uniref:Alpha/beta hydrolase n=1 Tax=Sphingomonas ginkgonis TaxID=2315330 RepID=A0A429VC12_9SPHN|nr:alpha/beta hydrolase [Sphingomonas ginkgonis]RST31494.1 alpha/beta hydrolase [Sphingomonas ginkgonis]